MLPAMADWQADLRHGAIERATQLVTMHADAPAERIESGGHIDPGGAAAAGAPDPLDERAGQQLRSRLSRTVRLKPVKTHDVECVMGA